MEISYFACHIRVRVRIRELNGDIKFFSFLMPDDLVFKTRIVFGCPDKAAGSQLQIRSFRGSAFKSLSIQVARIVNIYDIACLCRAVCDLGALCCCA